MLVLALPSPPSPFRALALASLVALSAAGCGRIGPLEPPPDASAPPKPAATTAAQTPDLSQVKAKIPPITPPNSPFPLDPLLK